MVGRLRGGWLPGVLIFAAVVRIIWFAKDTTELSPDGLAYLNLAREIRGVPLPADWDPAAWLPRNNQGAKPPGYPLFLNLVFWLAGHGPSPQAVVERLEARGVDAWHLGFIRMEENLRAVQAAQHVLGLLATWLAYATVLRWTGRPWLAAVTAGAAVGLRPSWVAMFEPTILTEALAGTLLLACVWSMTLADQKLGWGWALLASGLGGASVFVRPALIMVPPSVILGVLWMDRRRWLARASLLCLPPVLLIGGLVVSNGITYGYWGLSGSAGLNLTSHFRSHPEAFDDLRIRKLAQEFRDDRGVGIRIVHVLVTHHGLSLPEASALLARQSLGAAFRHPGVYLGSALGGFGEFWSSTEVLLVGREGGLLSRLPRPLWRGYLAVYGLAGGVGLLALLLNAPRAMRVSIGMVLVSAIAISLNARGENIRYAFPFQALLLISAAVLLDRALRRWEPGRP